MEQGGGAVRVMTVHGAKGLEAKLVILPDTVQIPDHERRGPLLYTEDCVFFGLPRHLECAPLTVAKTEARQKEMREYRRLLYVAATRAKDVLIVCGYQAGNQKQPPPDSWYSLLQSAAQRHGRAEEIDGEPVLVIGDPMTPGRVAQDLKPSRALPLFLTQAAQRENVSPLLRPSRLGNAEEPLAASPVADRQRLRRGVMVHALLAKLPEIADAERESAALGYLGARGITGAEAQSLTISVLRILHDPRFAPLFAETSRAEVAFTAAFPELGKAQIHGQIDRLAVTPTSVLIADFKTNRDSPQSADAVPKFYLAQMALYREALRRMHPDKAIECAFVWTDSAELMPVPAHLLEQEFTSLSEKAAAISAA
jgi:ATP-dependent helicase/nuclease subunit A